MCTNEASVTEWQWIGGERGSPLISLFGKRDGGGVGVGSLGLGSGGGVMEEGVRCDKFTVIFSGNH